MPPEPDAIDRLLLNEAAAHAGRRTAVVDDASGALVSGLSAPVRRAFSDSLHDERAVRAAGADIEVSDWLHPGLLDGAELVLARLPKSLAALDELAQAVAAAAAPSVTLLAGGRVKHMSRRMNEVLAVHFGSVRASLGRQKSRVLVARQPQPGLGAPYPRQAYDDELDLVVCAHGATFAGTAVDVGTRFLVAQLDRLDGDVHNVVDLGCGSGVRAVAAARRLPDAQVLALDDSAAAVRSAAATVRANGVADRVSAGRADGLEGVPTASVDLILCNPPFHRGTARDDDTALALFAQAGSRLRPGGELWVVWNSHLPYLPALRHRVGSTTVVAQNPRFTVTRSVRPAARA